MKSSTDKSLPIELLADDSSREILCLTSTKECSAIQLSNELDIPLATVYRKLKLLEKGGLIRHVKTIINLAGKEESFYCCLLCELTVRINKGTFSIEIRKEDYSDRMVKVWKRLVHPDSEKTI